MADWVGVDMTESSVHLETWCPIPGFTSYEASSVGRIRTVKTGYVRAGDLNRTLGYRQTTAAGRNQFVHHLVCLAFHGERPQSQEVRHLDGDKLNNCADNLAWGSRSENVMDLVHHGTHNNARKTHCPQGHEYTPENTRIAVTASGGPNRICRTCVRIRSQQWRDRHKVVM